MLSACGGGSNSASEPETTPVPDPIRVNAGSNLSIDENQSVALLGGSSGGQGAPTYTWQTDSSIQITHADTSITNAILIAPSVVQSSVFSVTLVATDIVGAQQSDTINVTVNPINIPPVAIIQANQISGYANNSFPVDASIILDGNTSFDADPQTSAAGIVAYNWQQIAGPNLLAGIPSTLSTITFMAPVSNDNQQATFRLTVTDQEQTSSSADFSIELLAQQESTVAVQASAVRSVFSGELVMLSAVAQSVAPDAPPFSAQWTQTGTALVNDPSAFTTFATSPLVLTDTTVSYQIIASDSFRNTASTQVDALVYAPSTRVINDSGVSWFTNDIALSRLHQNDYPGQDASYGADRQTASGQIIKVGEGEEGFDFSRLNNNGDTIDKPSNATACVRDNVTGLIWQVKENQDANSLNYEDQTFTWYAEDNNGNFAGDLNSGAANCNVPSEACNTNDYIVAINSQGMCGFFDWRLPTPNELQSIIHYGKTTPPMVDSIFFPHLGTSRETPLWYWTSQSSADGVSDDIARNAWAYDLNTGSDGFLDKTLNHHVILVRAGR
jgi:chitinase